MADSLILKGVHEVRKHTGDEMTLVRPRRSANAQHQLKRWWINGQVSTLYTSATVFDVTTAGGTVKLAIQTSPASVIRIDHDGSGAFDFYGVTGVDYAALFTENFELIEYYVMPRLAGGKVMTVKPAGSADLPSPPAPAPSPTIRGGAAADTVTPGPDCPKEKPKKKKKIVVDVETNNG